MTTNIIGLTITSNEIKIDYTQGPILPFAYYYGDTEPSNLPTNISIGFTLKQAVADDILTKNDVIYFDTSNNKLSVGNDLEEEWYYPMQYTTLGILISNNIKVTDIYSTESLITLVASIDPDIKNIYDNKALDDKVYQFYTTFGRFNVPDKFNDYNLIITPIKTVETSVLPFIYEEVGKLNNPGHPEYITSKQNEDLQIYYFSKIFVYNTDIKTTTDLKTKLQNAGMDTNTLKLIEECISDKNVLLSSEITNNPINPKLKDNPLDYLLIYIDINTNKIYYIIINKPSAGTTDTFTQLSLVFSNNVQKYLPDITSKLGANYTGYANTYAIGISPPTYYKSRYILSPPRLDFVPASTTSDLINVKDKWNVSWKNEYIATITLYSGVNYINPIKLFSYNIIPTNVFMLAGLHIDPTIYRKLPISNPAGSQFLNCISRDQLIEQTIYSKKIVPPNILIDNVYPSQSDTTSQIFSLNHYTISNILYDTTMFPTYFFSVFNNSFQPTDIYNNPSLFPLNHIFFKPTSANPSYPLDKGGADKNTDKSLNALAFYGTNIISLKKDISGTNLPHLSCDNPYGHMDSEKRPYPTAMFTPFTDTGLYPPIVSNGNGLLWKNEYHFKSDKSNCKFNAVYNNFNTTAQNTKLPNTFGFMSDKMNGDTNMSGPRFITLAFLMTSLTKKDIRPCFASTDFGNVSWMYDTMVDYYAEKNSLDIWINSIRQKNGDVILSYGGYNGTMSADALILLNPGSVFTDTTTFIKEMATPDILKNIDWKWDTNDLPLLSKYGIGKINEEHDKSPTNYSWGYTGPDTDHNNDQYKYNLYACYYLPARYYKVRWIDFDIEAASQNYTNWKSHIIRITALKKLMMTHPYINVRFTFPANPTGLVQAYPILWLTMFSFQKCEVSVRKRLYVNLMTMDYGDNAMTEAGFGTPAKTNQDDWHWDRFHFRTTDYLDPKKEWYKQLAQASILAVCNTARQMRLMSKEIYKKQATIANPSDYWLNEDKVVSKWSEGYLAKIGNTPMIGLNDNNFSVLTNLGAKAISGINGDDINFIQTAKDMKVKLGLPVNGFQQTTIKDRFDLWKSSSEMVNNMPPEFSPYLMDITKKSTTSLYDVMISEAEGFTDSFGPSGHVSMWSLNRDIPCSKEQTNIKCSGGFKEGDTEYQYQDKTLEFSEIFQKGVEQTLLKYK